MDNPDFESIKQTNVLGHEYWSARDLMPLLGYSKQSWHNFVKAIIKAMEACELAQQDISKHFVPVNHLVHLGSGAQRNINNYYFTRYATHLVLLLADPKKPKIMQAIAYFTLSSLEHADYLDVAHKCKLLVPSSISVTKEQKTLEKIKRAFKHLKSVEQYKIGHYRIDLYFPEKRVAVECDESGHRYYPPEEERSRQGYIEQKLKCTFIRYNPNSTDFHIGDVINKIMEVISR